MKVLSNFSKAVKNAKALSFGRSAISLCDKRCRMLKEGFCYAERAEGLYPDYYNKLNRNKRLLPENLLERAQEELPSLKWFRFSVSGSVPPKKQIKNFNKFKKRLQNFCNTLLENGTNIHFPVESIEKARTYRAILKNVVIRRTIQTKNGLKHFKDHAAYVIGEKRNQKNLVAAYDLANKLRTTGKTAVVCPAVFKNKHGVKSKCGQCTACASSKVDIVIYPLH